MKRPRRKQCRHCRCPMQPDPRAAKVQKYCSRRPCQQARQRVKYRRWMAAHPAEHRAALRAFTLERPDYWRGYRAGNPDYVRRDNLRRAEALRAARRSAKQTDWRQVAVERLEAIAAPGMGQCSAKQTDCARRVNSLVEFLRWTVERPCSAKQTGMAWVGGTAG